MTDQTKKLHALAFLNFCCRLAVYPTKQGMWVLQAARKINESGSPAMTEDELYEAFENNKLEELLKGAIGAELTDIDGKFPKYDHKY